MSDMELRGVLDPRHTALIVVDPQHDFCSPEGAIARRFGFDMKEIGEAVVRLNGFIESCRSAGVPVVWIREVFSENRMRANERALWGEGEEIWLIREGSPGADWYQGMIAPAEDEPVVTKFHYDAFEDTDLHLRLQARGIQTLLMTGFTTNLCVETSARHGYIKGYTIVLVSDCAGATTPAEHESAVFNIGTYFGKALGSSQVTGLWEREKIGVAGS